MRKLPPWLIQMPQQMNLFGDVICPICEKEKILYCSRNSKILRKELNEEKRFEGESMKKFVIRIDNHYYAGEGQPVKRNASSGGWHIQNLGSSSIAVGSREDAKVIEGYTNLRSHWERIHEGLRFKEFDCNVIVIEAVNE